jgi:MscS family membrane protein
LASKDAIANLFGSVNLLADRPFEIGDWVVVEGVEGNVETVGFRSTRIRTPNNSLVTLPNSRLTTAVLDNLGRRRYRRVKMTLPLAYDTPPERIEAFCEGIRELIRRHPYTRKDYYHVYFHQFSAAALDVLLDSFLDCQDLAVELRERHRLLVDVLRLAEGLRIAFAAPPRPAQNAANVSKESLDDDARLLRADPPQAGRRRAAQIAGPLVPPEKRPGPVVFDGASPVD